MKQQLLRIVVFCAACLVLGAQAQSSGSSSGSSTYTPGSSSDTSGSSSQSSGASGWMSRHLSATGRMGHHDMKASQLNGSEVKSSSGETLGTISDVIVNPGSGRMDFAILSLSSSSSSGAATSPSGSSTGSSTSPSSSSSSQEQTSSSTSSGGKQVAVPWMLLRPSSSSTSSSTTSSTAGQQTSFTFIGDPSKLQSAPNFDQNTDVTQTSWRQSVFSYFGLTQPGSSVGGAESPGGSGSQQQQSPGSSGQQ